MRVSSVGALTAQHFGQGFREPYAKALVQGSGKLMLRPQNHQRGAGGHETPEAVEYDVSSWCGDASALEISILSELLGPVLDIGCGPGRMLAAARSMGLQALGVDTSSAAVRRVRGQGGQALEQSVFEPLPHPGGWQSILLLDGNIGIGGNIALLLRRCRQLIAPTGALLIEVDSDPTLDTAYTAVLEDELGNRSESFKWARTGGPGVVSRSENAGWVVAGTSSRQGRVFVRLEPRLAARSIT